MDIPDRMVQQSRHCHSLLSSLPQPKAWTWTMTFILALTLTVTLAQSDSCATDATTCCQCGTKPGCSWKPDPVTSSYSCQSQHNRDDITNDLTINVNRPLNPVRRRTIAPQQVRLKSSLGVRSSLVFNVYGRSRRTRLLAVGEVDGPEFHLERADHLSCAEGFTIRTRRPTRSTGRGRVARRRNRGPPRDRRTIECQAPASRSTQRLRILVDMNKCFVGDKVIKISVREARAKRMRITVSSACSCPCQEAASNEDEHSSSQCQSGQDNYECESTQPDRCQGVNNRCRLGLNETDCSGRGTCVCGECMCDPIHTHFGLPHNNVSRFFTGQVCECDNSKCPQSNDLLCGGPERGECICGSCRCKPTWSGDACQISVIPCENNCYFNGVCQGGTCVCYEGYEGPLCQDCPSCSTNCQTYSACVLCLVTHNDSMYECRETCGSMQNQTSFQVQDDVSGFQGDICIVPAGLCNLVYAYSTSGQPTVFYRSSLVCPESEAFARISEEHHARRNQQRP